MYHSTAIKFIDTSSSARSTYKFDRITLRLASVTNDFDRMTLVLNYNNNSSEVESITSGFGPQLSLEYNSQGLVDVISLTGEGLEPRVSRFVRERMTYISYGSRNKLLHILPLLLLDCSKNNTHWACLIFVLSNFKEQISINVT